MLKLELNGARRILLLGAHSDDIEIGCGATILTLLKRNPKLQICWIVFSADGKRKDEARAGARSFLGGAKDAQVTIKSFRASYFPSQFERIKSYLETLKTFAPDVVFTHYRADQHQDHRVISDLTWNTFRDHFILEYEIPKYDGDFGQPNFFVPLERSIVQRKVRELTRVFATQRDKHWFDEETFRGLMRLRGMECASGYAEGFYARKTLCG